MQRRQFLGRAAAAAGVAALVRGSVAGAQTASPSAGEGKPAVKPDAGKPNAPAMANPGANPYQRTDAEWRKTLTPEQYYVLRTEGTEHPGTSPLNREKRKGTYVCVACELPLFSSETKYESGTGWPSFYDKLAGGIATRVERQYLYPVSECHCSRCGGHQGHVFNDGPKPTGLRYCINGIALKFVPA